MYFSRNVFMSVYHVPLLSLILIVFLHVFIFQKVAVNVEEQNRLKFAPKLRTRRFGSRLNGSYKDCFFLMLITQSSWILWTRRITYLKDDHSESRSDGRSRGCNF